MKLIDFINKYHGGSQVAFAKANGLAKQDVWRRVQSGTFYVYDNMLMQVRKEDIK